MKAKKEAIELVQDFKNEAKDQIFYDWDYYHIKCALFCVNKMLKVCKSMLPKTYIDYGSNIQTEINNLENVKLEIEKL